MPESALAPLIMQGMYPLPLEDFFFLFLTLSWEERGQIRGEEEEEE